MPSKNNKLIVILGSTASGKSDLAIALARKYNGEIISTDSRQVYRGMDIGTGKVTKREQRMARHHLLDVVSPKKTYTVHHFQRDALKAIRKIQQRGKLPILCGGTGFWIETVLSDAKLPAVKPNPELRKKLARLTPAQLYVRLKKLDPARARSIDRHNPVRLIRALEIVMTTRKPVPPLSHSSPYDKLVIGVKRPASKLRKRIQKRLAARLRKGMIAEVKRLRKSGVSDTRLIDLGLEYRYVTYFLQGKIPRTEMERQLTGAIQDYAKRQMTWYRRMHKRFPIYWITKHTDAEILTKKFLNI